MKNLQIPFKDIETIFLDAGNTLLSMDFPWIRDELKKLGIKCGINELERAEAAARPDLSSQLERLKSTETRQTSIFYMGSILNKLPAASVLPDKNRNGIIEELVIMLQEPDRKQRLWSNLIPGVREALDTLKKKGIGLAVVSNSNGMIEEILSNLGIRNYFDHVFDSHYVGYEKPDVRLFRHALDISDADPERTLHIGDLYHIDVLGAWSAGIHALLLDPFGDWQDVDCVRMPDLLSFSRMMEGI
jgi:HAD superfamily hydrolase (TIGR01509 family)